jgi:hypothetical protein
VIATAKKVRRSLGLTDSPTPKREDRSAAAEERRAMMRARREAFFARPIEFIPCAAFRRADAEEQATVPPAAALVPLERRGETPAEGRGLTPYLASLYQTRLLTKEEEQFYFRRMNWLKYRAARGRKRLDRRRATIRQMEEIEGWLAEAETVKAILITSNLRLVVSIAKKFIDASWTFDELVSEGNVSLMRAVEKFNFAHLRHVCHSEALLPAFPSRPSVSQAIRQRRRIDAWSRRRWAAGRLPHAGADRPAQGSVRSVPRRTGGTRAAHRRGPLRLRRPTAADVP